MYMRKVILAILILLLAGAGGYFYYRNFVKPKAVHFHAGFKVYVDGKLMDFSDIKYMNIEPCKEHEGEFETRLRSVMQNFGEAKEDEQIEKAHLHDFVGDIVHVHRSNAVWGDLFQNIKFRIDSSKPMLVYINGRIVDDVLDYSIHAYDSLVLIIGKHNRDIGNYLKTAVKKEHIEQTEKKSETCGN